VWVAEIQSGIEQVTNPKAAAALRDAQVDITALLDMIGPARQLSAAATVSTGPAG
jgi:hypothetical protein